jgi:hypothetical protein
VYGQSCRSCVAINISDLFSSQVKTLLEARNTVGSQKLKELGSYYELNDSYSRMIVQQVSTVCHRIQEAHV